MKGLFIFAFIAIFISSQYPVYAQTAKSLAGAPGTTAVFREGTDLPGMMKVLRGKYVCRIVIDEDGSRKQDYTGTEGGTMIKEYKSGKVLKYNERTGVFKTVK